MFLTTLTKLAEEIGLEAVKVCEIVVDEFWRAGEGSAIKQLRDGILRKLHERIEAGGASSQLVGAWRRMWILDPNSNEKGKYFFLPAQITTTGYSS